MDAFLVHQEILYRPDESSSSIASSPVSRLIEGIWNHAPSNAISILRERIHTNYPLNPFCAGMIKVCAKRSQVHSPIEFNLALKAARQAARDEVFLSPKTPPVFRQADFPNQLRTNDEIKHWLEKISDDSIGAILLSSDHTVLGYAKNTAEAYRTQHAEMNLIQNYLDKNGRLIPEGSKIAVSLKPCAMCAAKIMAAAERYESLEIIYLHDDPGPKANNSVLIKDSDLWKKAGSPALPKITQLV